MGCNVLEFAVGMGFEVPFEFGMFALTCGSLEFRPFDEKGGSAFVEGAFAFAIVPGGCVD